MALEPKPGLPGGEGFALRAPLEAGGPSGAAAEEAPRAAALLGSGARIFARREEKYELDQATAAWLEDRLAARLPRFSYHPGFLATYVTTVYFDTQDRKFYWRAEQDYDDNVKIRVREYYYRSEDERAPAKSDPGNGVRTITEGVCYVELKQRSHGQVTKKRFGIPKTALETLFLGNDVWDILVDSNPASEPGALADAYGALRGYLGRYRVEVTSVVNYRRKVYQREESDLRVTLDDRVAVYPPPRGLYTVADALTREWLGVPIRESERVILEIKCPGEYPAWLKEALGAFSSKRLSKFTTSVRLLLGDSACGGVARGPETS